MDIIIFLVLTVLFAVVFLARPRKYVLGCWLVALVLVLIVFNHHVTDPLNLEF